MSHATDFLARSTLSGIYPLAYTHLIDGLDADGLFAKFDVLHIYASQDSANALLNLVSTSYNGVIHGSPTFTVNKGFTGVDGSSTVYIDTGFNAATAPSPKFVQNSAHLSVWNVTNPGGGMNGAPIGTATPSSGAGNYAQPQNTTGNCVLKANGNTQLDSISGSGIGHHVANRSGANARDGYRNAVNIQNITSGANSGSIAVQNGNIYTLAHNNLDTPVPVGSGFQVAMISIGSSLTPTDVTNFYNRLQTYMTEISATYAQVTQLAAEDWTATAPIGRLTQLGVEEWTVVGGTPTIGLVTQIAVEQWVTVTRPSQGFNMPMLGM